MKIDPKRPCEERRIYVQQDGRLVAVLPTPARTTPRPLQIDPATGKLVASAAMAAWQYYVELPAANSVIVADQTQDGFSTLPPVNKGLSTQVNPPGDTTILCRVPRRWNRPVRRMFVGRFGLAGQLLPTEAPAPLGYARPIQTPLAAPDPDAGDAVASWERLRREILSQLVGTTDMVEIRRLYSALWDMEDGGPYHAERMDCKRRRMALRLRNDILDRYHVSADTTMSDERPDPQVIETDDQRFTLVTHRPAASSTPCPEGWNDDHPDKWLVVNKWLRLTHWLKVRYAEEPDTTAAIIQHLLPTFLSGRRGGGTGAIQREIRRLASNAARSQLNMALGTRGKLRQELEEVGQDVLVRCLELWTAGRVCSVKRAGQQAGERIAAEKSRILDDRTNDDGGRYLNLIPARSDEIADIHVEEQFHWEEKSLRLDALNVALAGEKAADFIARQNSQSMTWHGRAGHRIAAKGSLIARRAKAAYAGEPLPVASTTAPAELVTPTN